MRSFRIYIICLSTILVNVSCDNKSDQVQIPFSEAEHNNIIDTVFIDNYFPEFPSPIIPEILEDLGLCSTDKNIVDSGKSYCSSELFRVFPLTKEENYEMGFILDTRTGVLDENASKAIMVFVNINNRLVMQNLYKGKLLELRRTNGVSNLLMNYRVPELGHISVLHKWNTETKNYIPVNVEEINNHFIKEEYKDSVNYYFLNDFQWGY